MLCVYIYYIYILFVTFQEDVEMLVFNMPFLHGCLINNISFLKTF